MSRQSGDTSQELGTLAPIVTELEAALLEYVERYGPTDRARTILMKISKSSTDSTISNDCDPFPTDES